MTTTPLLDQVYCDYAATAPLRPEVQEAMLEAGRLPGNPSSIHRSGQVARVMIERARQTVAEAIGAETREVIFTSGGTEANNTIFPGILNSGDHVVTSSVEHPSVLKPLERLAARGVTMTQVDPSAGGNVDVAAIADALTDATKLITVMAVNNETGAISDIRGLGTLAAERGIYMHTDAVQAFGKVPIDVVADGIHFMAASAHKIGGPKGTGLLYARKGTPLTTLLTGGEQENNQRGGTENVAGAVGFAKAVEITMRDAEKMHQQLAEFRETFSGILNETDIDYRINGDHVYDGILNLQFDGVDGQPLVINLDARGFATSYGSSCASGSTKASHVLLAMGLTHEQATSSIRLSFGYNNTLDEIKALAAEVCSIVTKRQNRGVTVG